MTDALKGLKEIDGVFCEPDLFAAKKAFKEHGEAVGCSELAYTHAFKMGADYARREVGELYIEIDRLQKVNDMTNLVNEGLRRVLANARIVNNANPDIRLTNALRDYDKNPLPVSSAESKERLSNTIIEQLQRAHKATVGELVEALEKIEDYFCACSIDDEIIPQVVAHEALAKLRGEKE